MHPTRPTIVPVARPAENCWPTGRSAACCARIGLSPWKRWRSAGRIQPQIQNLFSHEYTRINTNRNQDQRNAFFFFFSFLVRVHSWLKGFGLAAVFKVSLGQIVSGKEIT